MAPAAVRVLFVGPTSRPWEAIESEVSADLERLERPGVELAYRCTGSGPADVHSPAEAERAAPGVVAAVRRAEAEGFSAVVIDCTEDPGAAEAALLVTIPVIGPGAVMQRAIAMARSPVVVVSGGDLRSLSVDELKLRTADAATVALGATGWSHVADQLVADRPALVVLDPLSAALDVCMEHLGHHS